MIRPVPHIGKMAPYALADLGDEATVSLAQNESAFPASPHAISAGARAIESSPLYPDPDWHALRTAIAEVHGLNPTSILCGAGSMELIGCLIRAFAAPGDHVLGTDYGYAFVASATAQIHVDYVKAHEVNLKVSTSHILAAVTARTKIVFLCNPGNPTGTVISNADIVALRDALPDAVLLVIDQAYAEFVDKDQNPAEVFALVDRGNTVVMRTFSKAYALAAARVGWGVFPEAIATEMRKLLNPNNISTISQVMAQAAMHDQQHMHQIVEQTASIRDRFSQACSALGIAIPQSRTNFALLRFDTPETARRIDAALRREKFLMRGMAGYGLPDCLRATICNKPIMDAVLSVLRKELS